MKTTTLAILTLISALGAGQALADGAEIYKQHCVKCHGADAKGETTMGKKLKVKDYSDPKTWEAAGKDEKIKASLSNGIKEGDKVVKKPFKDLLKPEEIDAVIAHMKTLAKK